MPDNTARANTRHQLALAKSRMDAARKEYIHAKAAAEYADRRLRLAIEAYLKVR
jgi:hypothetical protein